MERPGRRITIRFAGGTASTGELQLSSRAWNQRRVLLRSFLEKLSAMAATMQADVSQLLRVFAMVGAPSGFDQLF